jgi:hypothetical protein
LLTTKALAYLDSKVPGRSLGVYTIQLTGTGSGAPKVQDQNLAFNAVATARLLGGWGDTTENFVRIGHSLLALLAGWFGGLLSRRLCQCSEAQEPSTAVDVEGTNP